MGDIDNMQSKIKSWLNQDAFEKPQEEVLYRKKEDGGLNLTNIKLKMKAYLITNFLQTAINKDFNQNLYHKTLYDYYVHGAGIKTPPLPTYYSQEFFDEIKIAENKGHETISMKVRDWYDLLIKKYMMHCEENGDLVLKKS